MKLIVILLASAMLAACATGDRQAVLQNLQGCERHYSGVVTGGLVGSGFSGSVKIACIPKPGPIP